MEILNAVILGIVEGVTEFLPVSSTGHLIVAGELLGFKSATSATFEIFIQLGAILAVALLYRRKFLDLLRFDQNAGFSGTRGLTLLALTTLPALVMGALLHGFIKRHLFSSFTVAIGLGVGGIAIILVERLLLRSGKEGLDALTMRDAFLIGCFQCLAMWPGVSRSGATIIGALLIGIHRKTATEYSFLAAVPVMCAAVGFDLLKSYRLLTPDAMPFFAVGFAVSFVSAWFAVKFFLKLVSTRTLEPFGWYRLALASLLFFK